MKSIIKKVFTTKSFTNKPIVIVASNSNNSFYVQDLISNIGIHLSKENIELLYKMTKSNLRKVNQPVHYGIYSDNKNIELACGEWVTPKWGREEDQRTEDDEVFVGENESEDLLYTFSYQKTTCKKCKSKKSKK